MISLFNYTLYASLNCNDAIKKLANETFLISPKLLLGKNRKMKIEKYIHFYMNYINRNS